MLPSAVWLSVRTVLERRVVRAGGGIALHCEGGRLKIVEITPAAPALGEERDGGGCDTNSTHVGKYVHFSSAHARLCRAEEGPGVRVRVRLRKLYSVYNIRSTTEEKPKKRLSKYVAYAT